MARYDDVDVNREVSIISMSINNGLLTQLLSIQQLLTQSRFKSHRTTRPPQTPAASFLPVTRPQSEPSAQGASNLIATGLRNDPFEHSLVRVRRATEKWLSLARETWSPS